MINRRECKVKYGKGHRLIAFGSNVESVTRELKTEEIPNDYRLMWSRSAISASILESHFFEESIHMVSRSRPRFSSVRSSQSWKAGTWSLRLSLVSSNLVPWGLPPDIRSPIGTGKTATFSISVLQSIDTDLRECQALILSPTRELAVQIQKVGSFSVTRPILESWAYLED